MSVLHCYGMPTRVRRFGVGLLLASAITLSACAKKDERPDDLPTDPNATGSVENQQKSLENTQRWAKYWEKNPNDIGGALSYAAHLRAIGSNDQALAVVRKTTMNNPENPQILEAYGKQLASVGQLPEASKVLYKAIAIGKPTWQLYSLQGTVLDRMGNHTEAQNMYGSALKLSPDNTTIMNNKAMSHALSGDPKTAEKILRGAVAKSDDASSERLRQNLALMLGLQGKFDEARAVLAKVLPAHLVKSNMAYIKKMISQPNTWKQIQSSTPANG